MSLSMAKFVYKNVIAFRQQDKSPIQVAFVAHAADVLQWAGVPRKSDELLTGYQRFRDDKRIDQEIVPYFQNPANCSPTAAIIALRRETGVGRCQLGVTDVPVGEVITTDLTIEVDESLLDGDELFEHARSYVHARFANQGDENEETEVQDEDADDYEISSDEDESSEVENDEDDTVVHLGSATLDRLAELLNDQRNWKNAEFREAIADYVRPAFLIDGQHRISAAAKIGITGLPFMICGLYDAPWEEQVFQFTVVNLKPKRIPPALITSIAALSLTKDEQDVVEIRLRQAGIKMAEVTVMSLVAYDENSPFSEMIDMAVAGPSKRGDLLGYGGMKRIAKDWYRANRTSLTNIAKQFYNTNNASSARARWRAERTWFEFFCLFWNAVRNYAGEALWEKSPDNKLIVAANLWALQEVLLTAADGQMRTFWQLPGDIESPDERHALLTAKFLEVVNTTLAYFPREMWTTAWAKASQDTTAGRKELLTLFDIFVEQGKKTGKVWKAWRSDAWFASATPKSE